MTFWKDIFKSRKIPHCTKCGLDKFVNTPKMEVGGEGRLGAMALAEAPGEEEDLRGEQLVGKAGQLLEEAFRENGVNLHKDLFKLNAVNCRPMNKQRTSNRPPSPKELSYCKPYVEKCIEDIKPKAILMFGGKAIESYLLDRHIMSGLKKEIGVWVDHYIPDYKYNAWVIPLYHPSFVARNSYDENLKMVFENSIRRVSNFIQNIPPLPTKPNWKSNITLLTEFDDVIAYLKGLLENRPPILVFDYETNSLDPFIRDFRVECVGVSTDKDLAYVFPYQRMGHFSPEKQKQIKVLWKKVLRSTKIGKVAQGFPFEDRVSRVGIGCKVNNWKHCTLLAQHCLHPVNGTKSLKFQAFVRWGIEDYTSVVENFLKSKANSKVNEIHRAPLKELMLYCGGDALFEHWLYLEQSEQLGPSTNNPTTLRRAYNFLHQGLKTLTDFTIDGIRVDTTYYKNTNAKLLKDILGLMREIELSHEAKLFYKKTGKKLNINSNDHLQELLFDFLGYKSVKETKTGNPCVDVEVLSSLSSEVSLVDKIQKIRKLEKVQSTYIAPYIFYQEDDYIHPDYSLHKARSGRSSSSNPNIQNVPVRDDFAKKMARSGIIPEPGNHFGETDYGSLEVRILACYTKDPIMIKYINNPETDMHRDEALEIFLLPLEELTSKIRFHTKNGWVFPEFYGSYWKTCGRKIWEEVIDKGIKLKSGVDLKTHLRRQGIMGVEDFQQHLKEHESNFWNKFQVSREYQENCYKDYLKKGYVETKFGFRRGGYLNRNKIINTPVQGTAFQTLLWSCIELGKGIKKFRMKGKLKGQVHDSIIHNTPPEEIQDMLTLQEEIMCKRTNETFDWLIVPLVIEAEVAPLNRPWFYKNEYVRDDNGKWAPKPKKVS